MSAKKSICVFCGASSGNHPIFTEVTEAFGKAMVAQNYRLVYGGGNTGLMGILANAVLAAGGEVVGFMPQYLVDRERAHQGLNQLIIVGDLMERKVKMMEASDAFVTLPGGFGSLDELFEVITWKQLGLHQKPIALLNVQDFYTPLMDWMNRSAIQGFHHIQASQLLIISNAYQEILERISQQLG